jgi:hypothetical protein
VFVVDRSLIPPPRSSTEHGRSSSPTGPSLHFPTRLLKRAWGVRHRPPAPIHPTLLRRARGVCFCPPASIHYPSTPPHSSRERGACVFAHRHLHLPPIPGVFVVARPLASIHYPSTPTLFKSAQGICRRPPAPPSLEHENSEISKKTGGEFTTPPVSLLTSRRITPNAACHLSVLAHDAGANACSTPRPPYLHTSLLPD